MWGGWWAAASLSLRGGNSKHTCPNHLISWPRNPHFLGGNSEAFPSTALRKVREGSSYFPRQLTFVQYFLHIFHTVSPLFFKTIQESRYYLPFRRSGVKESDLPQRTTQLVSGQIRTETKTFQVQSLSSVLDVAQKPGLLGCD